MSLCKTCIRIKSQRPQQQIGLQTIPESKWIFRANLESSTEYAKQINVDKCVFEAVRDP